jgi:lysophospholipase L1-like esterase
VLALGLLALSACGATKEIGQLDESSSDADDSASDPTLTESDTQPMCGFESSSGGSNCVHESSGDEGESDDSGTDGGTDGGTDDGTDTDGCSPTICEAPPDGLGDDKSQFAYWIRQAHPDWIVLNRGVNGERSDEIAARFDRDVAAHRPDVVIVIAGVNDVYQGRNADEVTARLHSMYGRARAAGIAVVAGTIVPYNTATPSQNDQMHAVNAWIAEEAARDSNVLAVDTRAAVAAPDNPDLLTASPDGLHPDVDGYRRMAEALEPAILKQLAANK